MRRRPAWRAPAWFARPAARIAFQRRLAAGGQAVRAIPPPHRFRGGFALAVQLRVADVVEQTVSVVFGPGTPDVPHVYTDGPSESPHRYSDGALCMWYPYDAPAQRWVRADGPEALLGHVVAHLLREQWWRSTGEWAGQEAPHSP